MLKKYKKHTPTGVVSITTILALLILFSTIAPPALGQLTDADLNQIRLIVKEEVKSEITASETRMKSHIADKIEGVNNKIADKIEGVNNKIEGVESNISTVKWFIGIFAAVITAFIGILLSRGAKQSPKDNDPQEQIEALREEFAAFKQHHAHSTGAQL